MVEVGNGKYALRGMADVDKQWATQKLSQRVEGAALGQEREHTCGVMENSPSSRSRLVSSISDWVDDEDMASLLGPLSGETRLAAQGAAAGPERLGARLDRGPVAAVWSALQVGGVKGVRQVRAARVTALRTAFIPHWAPHFAVPSTCRVPRQCRE